MKRIITGLFCCFLFGSGFSQISSVSNHVAVGDLFRENLKLLDTTFNTALVKIPADTAVLFYRYRGNNWLLDNRDSVQKVESIANDLINTSKEFRNLKLICYSYNKDQYLNSYTKQVFIPNSKFSVDYYFMPERNTSKLITSEKLILIDKKGKVLSSSMFISGFKYEHKARVRRLKAKLMTEKNGQKIPLVNASVYLFSKAVKDSFTYTKTNKYGDFELNVEEGSDFNHLKVEPQQKNAKTIILATQEGEEIAKLQKLAIIFEYKMIEADLVRLSDMYVDEDISMAFNNFMNGTEKEFVKAEHIKYKVGSFTVEEDTKKILNKIAAILEEKPGVKLEVISHTDSQGDDKSNMELSEKRSLNVVGYLIMIGAEANRLSYKGKGETQIRNRCVNDVDCSDIEHGYNRRTEFRFYKSK